MIILTIIFKYEWYIQFNKNLLFVSRHVQII